MYKYQCSKKDCEHIWTVQAGCLNGFTLTCPACGKGRGLFLSQTKDVEGIEGRQASTAEYKNKK